MKQRYEVTIDHNGTDDLDRVSPEALSAALAVGGMPGSVEVREVTESGRIGCTFYHANPKGTGSALRMDMIPSRGVVGGRIRFTIAPQDGASHPIFNWGAALKFDADIDAVARMLEVAIGVKELIRDGRGVYRADQDGSSIMYLTHKIEPVPGYLLEIANEPRSGSPRKVSFLVHFHEMLAISEALRGSMAALFFGNILKA